MFNPSNYWVRRSYHNDANAGYWRTLSKFVTTSEDWSPSFEGGFIHVTLTLLNTNTDPKRFPHHLLVTVMGADDSGMNKPFDLEDMIGAESLYNAVTDDISKDELIALGFKWW